MSADRYQLWGGCFEEEASTDLKHLNDSLSVDSRLFAEDIRGSRAWAKELNLSKHISDDIYKAIVEGLDKVEEDIKKELTKNGRLMDEEEDIHSVVESRLREYAGDAALHLHTARSRNDQSATDTKLWMLNSLKKLLNEVIQLISVTIVRAENEIDIIAPGYTHLQRAQPIRWSHFLLRGAQKGQSINVGHGHPLFAFPAFEGGSYLSGKTPTGSRFHSSLVRKRKCLVEETNRGRLPAINLSLDFDIVLITFSTGGPVCGSATNYVWLFKEDVSRLEEQIVRLSTCPLGSGAIAGCALQIDRIRLAHSLGFNDITPNSMCAVGSRDYIVEFLNWSALCGLHLSRFAEDLIIYSSQEFGIVQLSDKFSTGSSLMPQKRNPDGLELIRGAAGLLLGDSFSFACTLKGLPSTYNKDLQVDKEIMFRSYDRLMHCIRVMNGTIKTMTVKSEKAVALLDPGMLATDVAHYLVRRGVPFRRAHHVVGSTLRRAAALGVTLQNMPHEEYVAICPDFGTEDEFKKIFSWEASVEQYSSAGGTSRAAVLQQIQTLAEWLQKYKSC